ncbi:TIGR03086 family metal-binding protein [Actinocrispum sp. NPDC049592]|uniref:TIGR03086 family metal-binding protein n=1 Tax=Actinocrispum sp. NPDC049592 TaxID=3154835 RepID=UPI003419BD3F
MSQDQLIKLAVEPVLDVVRAIREDQLDAPTPCTDYTVRRLINHLLYWGPSLEAGARKEIVTPPETPEAEADLTDGWQDKLLAHLTQLAASWGTPQAWEGVTHMGGPTEMPATLVGGMVVGETVVHGWDLARATGQNPEWDADLLAYVHKELVANVQWGRDMGVYGPEVPVPADAPLIDRILGMTGRNPAALR